MYIMVDRREGFGAIICEIRFLSGEGADVSQGAAGELAFGCNVPVCSRNEWRRD